MGDKNPIRTLGDYSKPSHKGYLNTIELPIGNNVVPLRSDTIWLVQNGCSFHGLRSEDPNQHLKDFLKLVGSLDLDGDNKERTRLCLFQFSLHDQASNWLESLPAGSITTWEDLTTRFLTQFFPPGRTCEIDCAAGGKLRNKNVDESWEIIENLALYDHEGWDDTKEFVKPVKVITTPHGILKTLDIRLFELEDQINFLLKGSQLVPPSSSTHNSQAYVKAVHPNSRPQNQNDPPKLNTFSFHKGTGPSPQPQALETTFEARVWDYMAAHTERMERFENAILKQREEINGRMTEMFELLKELTTSRTPKKVLIREEAKFPVTKNVNSISLTKGEEERSNKTKITPKNTEKPIETEAEIPVKEVETKNGTENGAGNKSIKTPKNEEAVEAPGSQPVVYYLKHKINEKLIEGLVDNNRFNISLSGTRKKITKKEDIKGNFKIPCNIGGLKHVNSLVDQGSDVNVMPYSTYTKLTDKRPAETDIRLSLASHSYIYPLGIVEDMLVEVFEHIYPVDFVIMDIKENEKRPFILGMSIPEPLCHPEKGVKNDIEPIAHTMTVNRLVLEWEKIIRLHREIEMEFDQWRSKNFKASTLLFGNQGRNG
ncbi:MAK10-like protein [Tanacetum coccineum]